MRTAVLAVPILLLAGCVDADGARQTAEAYGFTNVAVTGASLFGCGKDDLYSTSIEATNPQGARVQAVVCAGGWGGKYGTLRIERVVSRGNSVPMVTR